MLRLDQYIEIREDNILTAVVRSTEANAHLVATAALAQGVELTAEQYHISMAQVHGGLAFYYENQTEIEQRYREAQEHLEQHAIDGWQRLEEMRNRKKNS